MLRKIFGVRAEKPARFNKPYTKKYFFEYELI